MELTGKIEIVLDKEGGTSKNGNAWEKQSYVLAYDINAHTYHCVFYVFGADRISQFNLQRNDEVKVSISIDAHDYNGRWYNDVSAYRVEHLSQPETKPTAQPTIYPGIGSKVKKQTTDNAGDDLPF